MTPRCCFSLSFLLIPVLSAFAATPPAPKFVPNYDESKVPAYTLPNALVLNDGTPVRDAATWRAKRRPELLEIFAREVYGRTLAGRPEKMHWAVTSVDRAALGGKAVRKEITIWFTESKSGPRMHMLVYQPLAASPRSPAPAFLGFNFGGNQAVANDPAITLSTAWMRPSRDGRVLNERATEASRGASAAAWDVETVTARGYATATIYYG